MSINELYLYNFRNLKSIKINLNFPEVYFVGKNGQGKTNILESIYYLCYGSSFRTKSDNLILTHGEKEMSAIAQFSTNDNFLNRIQIKYQNGQKKIIFNDMNIVDRRDIMRNMPCIVFCHGDLEFVVGSPDKKRLFFDQTLSLLNYDFINYLRKYKLILKNRNKLLKSNSNRELISVYTRQLVELGLVIQQDRKQLIDDFNSVLSKMFNNISDLKGLLKIEYLPSWKLDNFDELVSYIDGKIDYELKMKTSCYGPHRDNFKIIYDKKDFNHFASTGQLRLVSLILRSTQGLFYLEKTGRKPILLLDDVLLELDNDKRERFMRNLPDYSQAFYTFLPDSSALNRHNAKVFYVEEGSIKE